MSTSDPDLLDLNLAWLFKARELARSSHETAAVVLGLDRAVVIHLADLSLQDLDALARAEVMTFHPRFHPGFWHDMIEQRHWSSYAVQIQMVLMAAEEATRR